MKRLRAPDYWRVSKKTEKFIVKSLPGPHPAKKSIPLAVILRDILGFAKTLKEVKLILNSGIVKVNGIVRKSYNYPAGLMDSLIIGDNKYRILVNNKGLYLKDSKDTERIVRVKNKTHIKGGKLQLNFHDGTNMLVDKDEYSTGDVLLLNDNKVKTKIKFEKGSMALISGGSNQGKVGKIDKLQIVKSSQPNKVFVKIDKDIIEIPKDYIFVIGEKDAVIEV